MNILSPDTPPDLYPVPYAKRRVENVLPIAKNVVREMKDMGIRTLEHLDLFFARGGELTNIKGVGPKTAEGILEAYDSIQRTRRFTDE